MESKIQNPKSKIRLMLVAGEASGDKHAAHLASALKSNSPHTQFEFFGSGGDELAHLLVGSEGTLGLFTAATLHTSPLPTCRGVVLLQFNSSPAGSE